MSVQDPPVVARAYSGAAGAAKAVTAMLHYKSCHAAYWAPDGSQVVVFGFGFVLDLCLYKAFKL